MKHNYPVRRSNFQRDFAIFILAASLFLRVEPSFASEHYLTPGRPDGVALLAPPPIAGSTEALADLASARAVFNGRTPAEESRAKMDQGLSFSIFKRAIGPAFDLDKLPKTEALLKQVKAEIGDAINQPKNYWKRLRPYQVDSKLTLWEPENSYSYPSGHSTRGTVYALVLAEIFPDKKEAIMTVGREIGWDRVLIGKHFPTDVIAGRVLGQAIVRELLASPAFQRDLVVAKTEARTIRADQVSASDSRNSEVSLSK